MKFLKYVKIVFIVIIILIGAFAISVSFLGRRNAEFFHKRRIEALNELREIYYKHPGDLYIACCKSKKKYLSLPYNGGIIYFDIFRTNKKMFYKYIRYRVIKSGDWWGITELEYGIKGKYFFMISKNGAISKIEGAFLPEQETAQYPPALMSEYIPRPFPGGDPDGILKRVGVGIN